MYAVINHKSRQHRVRVGEVVDLDHDQSFEPGQAIVFDEVLAVGGEGEPKLGSPKVDGAKVEGKVLAQTRGKKRIAFRFKRRKGIRVKRGSRPSLTRVEITQIHA